MLEQEELSLKQKIHSNFLRQNKNYMSELNEEDK